MGIGMVGKSRSSLHARIAFCLKIALQTPSDVNNHISVTESAVSMDAVSILRGCAKQSS